MDALHDKSHRVWVSIGRKYQEMIPDYVMSYDVGDEKTASALVDENFADSARRLFPIDSPAATWLSNVYFTKDALDGTLPYGKVEHDYVKSMLKGAAAMYGVTPDVDKIVNAITKSAAPINAEDDDKNYGYVRMDKEGHVVTRRYPMFDAEGVHKAASYFEENRSKYPLSMRSEIAGNIMRKAAEYTVPVTELPKAVLSEAGRGLPELAKLAEELEYRADLTKDPEMAAKLAEVTKGILAATPKDIMDSLQKLAEVIERYDSAAGLLEKRASKHLPMPSDIIYSLDEMQAKEAIDDSVELDKYVFSITKLAELPLATYTDILGDDFADAISVKKADGTQSINTQKLEENLFSLPKPDKVALEEHILRICD